MIFTGPFILHMLPAIVFLVVGCQPVSAVTQFSGQMGTGKVIYERTLGSHWAAIPKGALAQSVWKYACGKTDVRESARCGARIKQSVVCNG